MSDGPRGEDIVEQGGPGPGRRFRLPGGWRLPDRLRPPGGWRSSRGAGVLAASTLVVGLVAGYAAGDHQARGGAQPAPEPAASPSARGGVRRGGGASRVAGVHLPAAPTGHRWVLGAERQSPYARRAVQQPVHGGAHPHVGQGRATARRAHPGHLALDTLRRHPADPRPGGCDPPAGSEHLADDDVQRQGCLPGRTPCPVHHRLPARRAAVPPPPACPASPTWARFPTAAARGHQRPPSLGQLATATATPDRGSNASR